MCAAMTDGRSLGTDDGVSAADDTKADAASSRVFLGDALRAALVLAAAQYVILAAVGIEMSLTVPRGADYSSPLGYVWTLVRFVAGVALMVWVTRPWLRVPLALSAAAFAIVPPLARLAVSTLGHPLARLDSGRGVALLFVLVLVALAAGFAVAVGARRHPMGILRVVLCVVALAGVLIEGYLRLNPQLTVYPAVALAAEVTHANAWGVVLFWPSAALVPFVLYLFQRWMGARRVVAAS